MPSWLITLVLNLVIKLGLAFIFKKFPGLPPEIKQILEWFAEGIKSHPEQKEALRKEANEKINNHYKVKKVKK